jgi:hypothetical protein
MVAGFIRAVTQHSKGAFGIQVMKFLMHIVDRT